VAGRSALLDPLLVQQIHGITPEMVKGKPTFEQVYPEFEAFVGDAVSSPTMRRSTSASCARS